MTRARLYQRSVAFVPLHPSWRGRPITTAPVGASPKSTISAQIVAHSDSVFDPAVAESATDRQD